MSIDSHDTTGSRPAQRFYHGTRADLAPGALVEPNTRSDGDARDAERAYVYLTPDLDAAVWDAETSQGDGAGRVYIVQPLGRVEDVPDVTNGESAAPRKMTHRSREPLRVTGEVTQWTLYHGTKADLKPGELIGPGHGSNYVKGKNSAYVYVAATLEAAVWGAELAAGEGRGRIYVVEPTGPIEDDPNLTDQRFRGNPTKSFRSREPLRVTAEVTDWQGHSPEALKAMRDGLERLERLGVEPIED